MADIINNDKFEEKKEKASDYKANYMKPNKDDYRKKRTET